MAPLFLTVALLSYHPFDPVVVETRVDLIELNHTVQGTRWAHQYIFWEHRPETLDAPQDGPSNGYRVVAWRWVSQVGKHPTTHRGGVELLWTAADGTIYRVWAPKLLETWSLEDPEVIDRKILPAAQRRGLVARPATAGR